METDAEIQSKKKDRQISEEMGKTPLLDDQRKTSYYSVIREKIIADASLENLTKIKTSLIESVIQGLKNRFSDNVSVIINSFQAYDPLSIKNITFSQA